MEQSEEWRPVAGYEDRYEVSSAGQVRRLADGHICHQRVQQATVVVELKTRSGSPSNYSVARLVAIAFNGKPPAGYFLVRHKDGDSKNNRPDNLYWVSSGTFVNSEESRRKAAEKRRSPEVRAKLAVRSKARWNTPDGKALLLRMGKKACTLTSKKVICLETGVIYPSVLSAANAFGFSKRAVFSSCQRAGGCKKNRMCHGTSPVFHFSYYKPDEWKPKERIWKPCVGFEGRYEVSNMGEVRRVRNHCMRTPYTSGSSNTLIVNMVANNGKMRYMTVARLVAEAFLPRVYGDTEVCHRDGDLSNNCVTNLYWSDCIGMFCNPVEQHKHTQARLRRSVICVETGKLYNSIKEAAIDCNLRETTVHMSCQPNRSHRNKAIKGKPILHFRYADQQ